MSFCYSYYIFFSFNMFANKSLVISWFKARQNLFRLQKRIYKCILVGDFNHAISLQKILVVSTSVRLLSIRFVTQNLFKENFSFQQSIRLGFSDKFNLSNFLLHNFTNWNPQKYKFVRVFDINNSSFQNVMVWSIVDRCWQCIVKFALEPSHEVFFSPRSLGFRSKNLFYQVQRVIFLNLSHKSYGFQKRILFIFFDGIFSKFDFNKFLKKLICPRFIKLGLFRFFKLGLVPSFDISRFSIDLFSSLLANIFFQEIDFFFHGLRYGYYSLIFLKPLDNELFILNKLFVFLNSLGIEKVCNFKFNYILFYIFSFYIFIL